MGSLPRIRPVTSTVIRKGSVNGSVKGQSTILDSLNPVFDPGIGLPCELFFESAYLLANVGGAAYVQASRNPALVRRCLGIILFHPITASCQDLLTDPFVESLLSQIVSPKCCAAVAPQVSNAVDV